MTTLGRPKIYARRYQISVMLSAGEKLEKALDAEVATGKSRASIIREALLQYYKLK